jgi:hypothetical protein
MPTLFAGAPFPFKIVFGIDDALLPAATAGTEISADEKSAIEIRMAKRLRCTGDLQVVGMASV